MLYFILIKKAVRRKSLNLFFQDLSQKIKQSLNYYSSILLLKGIYHLTWKHNYLIFGGLELAWTRFLNSFEYLYFEGLWFHALLAANIKLCLRFRAQISFPQKSSLISMVSFFIQLSVGWLIISDRWIRRKFNI